MNQLNKWIQIGVGIAVFVAVFWFVTRNQIITEYVRPSVESGKLGVASGNALSSLLEILAAVGAVVIAVATRLLQYIATSIEPLAAKLAGSSSTGGDSSATHDPKKLTEDLSRLLIQAVVEANRDLTIQLAHRIAKKEFLDSPGRQA